MKSDRVSTEKSAAKDGILPEPSYPRHEASGSVELHIEELVLRGFAPGDRFRIGDGLERELTRLLSEEGLRTNGPESIDRLDGGTIKVVSGARAPAVGAQIAQQVYRQLSALPLSGTRFENIGRE